MVQRSKLWGQAFLCALLSACAFTSQAIAEDKAALLAFKAAISSDQGLLASWTNTTDPCSDAWLGVSCDCSDLEPSLSAAACAAATKSPGQQAVVLLDLGNQSAAQGKFMTGSLTPQLGDLAQLQQLRLDSHKLEVCYSDFSW